MAAAESNFTFAAHANGLGVLVPREALQTDDVVITTSLSQTLSSAVNAAVGAKGFLEPVTSMVFTAIYSLTDSSEQPWNSSLPLYVKVATQDEEETIMDPIRGAYLNRRKRKWSRRGCRRRCGRRCRRGCGKNRGEECNQGCGTGCGRRCRKRGKACFRGRGPRCIRDSTNAELQSLDADADLSGVWIEVSEQSVLLAGFGEREAAPAGNITAVGAVLEQLEQTTRDALRLAALDETGDLMSDVGTITIFKPDESFMTSASNSTHTVATLEDNSAVIIPREVLQPDDVVFITTLSQNATSALNEGVPSGGFQEPAAEPVSVSIYSLADYSLQNRTSSRPTYVKVSPDEVDLVGAQLNPVTEQWSSQGIRNVTSAELNDIEFVNISGNWIATYEHTFLVSGFGGSLSLAPADNVTAVGAVVNELQQSTEDAFGRFLLGETSSVTSDVGTITVFEPEASFMTLAANSTYTVATLENSSAVMIPREALQTDDVVFITSLSPSLSSVLNDAVGTGAPATGMVFMSTYSLEDFSLQNRTSSRPIYVKVADADALSASAHIGASLDFASGTWSSEGIQSASAAELEGVQIANISGAWKASSDLPTLLAGFPVPPSVASILEDLRRNAEDALRRAAGGDLANVTNDIGTTTIFAPDASFMAGRGSNFTFAAHGNGVGTLIPREGLEMDDVVITTSLSQNLQSALNAAVGANGFLEPVTDVISISIYSLADNSSRAWNSSRPFYTRLGEESPRPIHGAYLNNWTESWSRRGCFQGGGRCIRDAEAAELHEAGIDASGVWMAANEQPVLLAGFGDASSASAGNASAVAAVLGELERTTRDALRLAALGETGNLISDMGTITIFKPDESFLTSASNSSHTVATLQNDLAVIIPREVLQANDVVIITSLSENASSALNEGVPSGGFQEPAVEPVSISIYSLADYSLQNRTSTRPNYVKIESNDADLIGAQLNPETERWSSQGIRDVTSAELSEVEIVNTSGIWIATHDQNFLVSGFGGNLSLAPAENLTAVEAVLNELQQSTEDAFGRFVRGETSSVTSDVGTITVFEPEASFMTSAANTTYTVATLPDNSAVAIPRQALQTDDVVFITSVAPNLTSVLNDAVGNEGPATGIVAMSTYSLADFSLQNRTSTLPIYVKVADTDAGRDATPPIGASLNSSGTWSSEGIRSASTAELDGLQIANLSGVWKATSDLPSLLTGLPPVTPAVVAPNASAAEVLRSLEQHGQDILRMAVLGGLESVSSEVGSTTIITPEASFMRAAADCAYASTTLQSGLGVMIPREALRSNDVVVVTSLSENQSAALDLGEGFLGPPATGTVFMSTYSLTDFSLQTRNSSHPSYVQVSTDNADLVGAKLNPSGDWSLQGVSALTGHELQELQNLNNMNDSGVWIGAYNQPVLLAGFTAPSVQTVDPVFCLDEIFCGRPLCVILWLLLVFLLWFVASGVCLDAGRAKQRLWKQDYFFTRGLRRGYSEKFVEVEDETELVGAPVAGKGEDVEEEVEALRDELQKRHPSLPHWMLTVLCQNTLRRVALQHSLHVNTSSLHIWNTEGWVANSPAPTNSNKLKGKVVVLRKGSQSLAQAYTAVHSSRLLLLRTAFFATQPVCEVLHMDVHIKASRRAKLVMDGILGSLAIFCVFLMLDASALGATPQGPLLQSGLFYYTVLALLAILLNLLPRAVMYAVAWRDFVQAVQNTQQRNKWLLWDVVFWILSLCLTVLHVLLILGFLSCCREPDEWVWLWGLLVIFVWKMIMAPFLAGVLACMALLVIACKVPDLAYSPPKVLGIDYMDEPQDEDVEPSAWEKKVEELGGRGITVLQLLDFYVDLPKWMPDFDETSTTQDVVWRAIIPASLQRSSSRLEVTVCFRMDLDDPKPSSEPIQCQAYVLGPKSEKPWKSSSPKVLQAPSWAQVFEFEQIQDEKLCLCFSPGGEVVDFDLSRSVVLEKLVDQDVVVDMGGSSLQVSIHFQQLEVEEGHGKAYASLVNRDVVLARKMVTHCWQGPFVDLLASVLADALNEQFTDRARQLLLDQDLEQIYHELEKKEMLHVAYWVCAFCVNQHCAICDQPPREGLACGCDTPKHRDSGETDGTLLHALSEMNKLDDLMNFVKQQWLHGKEQVYLENLIVADANLSLLGRTWCLAEVARAAELHLKQVVKLPSQTSRTRLLSRLAATDVATSETTLEADKEMILANIADVGSFNARVQAALLTHLEAFLGVDENTQTLCSHIFEATLKAICCA